MHPQSFARRSLILALPFLAASGVTLAQQPYPPPYPQTLPQPAPPPAPPAIQPAPPAAPAAPAATDDKTIKIGSVVQLQSGGPKMTVVALGAMVVTQWYQESASAFVKAEFPLAALKLATDEDEDDEDEEDEDEDEEKDDE